MLLPATIFAVVAALIFVGGLYEWDNLTTRSGRRFALAAAVLLAVCVALMLPGSDPGLSSANIALPALCLLGCVLWLYQLQTLTRGIDYQRTPGVELMLGVLTLVCAWAAMVWMRGFDPWGPKFVLLAILVVWAADIFA